MTAHSPSTLPDATADARLHASLRFATAVTAAFVLCELMRWAPTFLAPVLAAVLLANLPMRPPLKLTLVLVAAMALAAGFTFVMSSLLRGVPLVLFGAVALSLFLCFYGMLTGRAALPITLLLVCLATTPIIVMIAPSFGGILPMAQVRGIIIALAAIWAVHACWPLLVPSAQGGKAAPPSVRPLVLALASTAVVLPLMLVYLIFGWADALPVLVTTLMLVINFDPQRSRATAGAMIFGNFAGGLVGLLLHTLLLTTPSMLFLAAILFLILFAFGQRISAGGPAGAVALLSCNAMLIVLSSAIASGPGSLSIWLARLFQFALAGAFTVGMMTLIWRRAVPVSTAQAVTN